MSAPTAVIINICTIDPNVIRMIDTWLLENTKTSRTAAPLFNVTSHEALIDIPAMETWYGVYKVLNTADFVTFLRDLRSTYDGAIQVLTLNYHDMAYKEIYADNNY